MVMHCGRKNIINKYSPVMRPGGGGSKPMAYELSFLSSSFFAFEN